ncbi:MAG: hypothetical protein RBT70_09315 [Alphaproteobacteria bacterium]|jgi:hypothetical protein|nr:hypothetical protein [Alphaproteobacteria bacterium]
MTEQEKKPMSLKEKMAREEEIHDWRDALGAKIASYARKTTEAKEEGQFAQAAEFEKNWDEWSNIRSNGYSRAEETEKGRELLAHIRKTRQIIDG